MEEISHTLKFLLSPEAIKLSCAKVWEVQNNYSLDEKALKRVSDQLENDSQELIRDYEEFWSLKVEGENLGLDLLETMLSNAPLEKATTLIDLLTLIELLAPGQGERVLSEKQLDRHKKAIAAMFRSSLFSSPGKVACEADAIHSIPADSLAHGFNLFEQSTELNLAIRSGILRALATHLTSKPEVFSQQRPGNLARYFLSHFGSRLSAGELLQSLLYTVGPCYYFGFRYEQNLIGDVWHYAGMGEVRSPSQALAVFHRRFTRLAFAMIEPLALLGIEVTNPEHLVCFSGPQHFSFLLDQQILQKESPGLPFLELGSDVTIAARASTVRCFDHIFQNLRSKLEGLSVSKTYYLIERAVNQHSEKNIQEPLALDTPDGFF